MESKNDVHVFVILMCLGLNYDFNVLLNPKVITLWVVSHLSKASNRTHEIQ